MKKNYKIFKMIAWGIIAWVVLALIERQIVIRLDRDILMSGAGIEDRLATIDLDWTENAPKRQHCKRVRVKVLYEYQTCFNWWASGGSPQGFVYAYTPPRRFFSIWRFVVSDKEYFSDSVFFQGTAGSVYKNKKYKIEVRDKYLKRWHINPENYPNTTGTPSWRIIKQGEWK